MKTWFSGLRWLFLALGLLLGTMAQAVPVGGITDAQGAPVGVQDIPVRGDNPWKLHQRYCVESTTLATVQSAILGPNGLTDARRMPAGKQISIRCGELKVTYKESALFASPLREMIRATSSQVQKLEGRISELEGKLSTLHQTVQQVPREVDRVLSFPSSPFWRDVRFWMLALLILLFAAIAGFLAIALSSGRWREGFLQVRKSPRTSELGNHLWIEPLPDKGFSIYVLVFEEGGKQGRLFRFETRSGAANLYPDIFGRQHSTVDAVGRETVRVLNHYVSHTSPAAERREVERALQDRTLVEMSSPLRRL